MSQNPSTCIRAHCPPLRPITLPSPPLLNSTAKSMHQRPPHISKPGCTFHHRNMSHHHMHMLVILDPRLHNSSCRPHTQERDRSCYLPQVPLHHRQSSHTQLCKATSMLLCTSCNLYYNFPPSSTGILGRTKAS